MSSFLSRSFHSTHSGSHYLSFFTFRSWDARCVSRHSVPITLNRRRRPRPQPLSLIISRSANSHRKLLQQMQSSFALKLTFWPASAAAALARCESHLVASRTACSSATHHCSRYLRFPAHFDQRRLYSYTLISRHGSLQCLAMPSCSGFSAAISRFTSTFSAVSGCLRRPGHLRS